MLGDPNVELSVGWCVAYSRAFASRANVSMQVETILPASGRSVGRIFPALVSSSQIAEELSYPKSNSQKAIHELQEYGCNDRL